MTIKDLLHKRVLIAEKENGYSTNKVVKEIKILEISPSKNWVKILNDFGKKYWVHTSDVKPIEILDSIEIKGS